MGREAPTRRVGLRWGLGGGAREAAAAGGPARPADESPRREGAADAGRPWPRTEASAARGRSCAARAPESRCLRRRKSRSPRAGTRRRDESSGLRPTEGFSLQELQADARRSAALPDAGGDAPMLPASQTARDPAGRSDANARTQTNPASSDRQYSARLTVLKARLERERDGASAASSSHRSSPGRAPSCVGRFAPSAAGSPRGAPAGKGSALPSAPPRPGHWGGGRGTRLVQAPDAPALPMWRHLGNCWAWTWHTAVTDTPHRRPPAGRLGSPSFPPLPPLPPPKGSPVAGRKSEQRVTLEAVQPLEQPQGHQ